MEEDIKVFQCPENDQEMENKLGLMRAIVEQKDPASKDLDDSTLRRFLYARDLDVEKAASMFVKYLTWRRTFDSIPVTEIEDEIAQNKIFAQGKDKQGRPILVFFGARHFASKGGVEEFKKFMVFALDKLCSRTSNEQEKFVIIGDLEGFGYRNSDVRGYLGALFILQDFYPERLGKVFVLRAPYVFMTLWKIIYPFMDKKTKNKIVFVENETLQATLLEDIDESQLPDIYGGRMKLIPIQNA